MNPTLHDEFVALCALFYSGEISEEEWALLQVHLAYCEQCRKFFDEYKELTEVVIPELAAHSANQNNMLPESSASLKEAERRLIAAVELVPSADPRKPNRSRGRILATCIAASALIALSVATWRLTRKDQHEGLQTSVIQTSTTIASKPTQLEEPAPKSAALIASETEVAKLRNELESIRHQSRSEESTTLLEQRIQNDATELGVLKSQNDTLTQQLANAQSDAQDLREKLASLDATNPKQNVRIAELESQVRLLRASLDDTASSLNDKERMLALDQDFLAHDRDIRDLIGARNLYIADIFDTNEAGKTTKPFGRIFYTKDRSLVFYGFDLEKQANLKQSVAFQVWGSGTDRQPVNLGLFYQDDAHKRWVLRFDDAKTLARLNMVFVTVEPSGGSQKPTGKQLLRAYLQIQPNHP